MAFSLEKRRFSRGEARGVFTRRAWSESALGSLCGIGFAVLLFSTLFFMACTEESRSLVATRFTESEQGYHASGEGDADEALPDPTGWTGADDDDDFNGDATELSDEAEPEVTDTENEALRVLALSLEGESGNVEVTYEITGQASEAMKLLPGYKAQGGEWGEAHTTPVELPTQPGSHTVTWHSHLDLPFSETENVTFNLSWSPPEGENATVQAERLDNRYVVAPRRMDSPREIPAHGEAPQVFQARDATLYLLWKEPEEKGRHVWFNRASDGLNWDAASVEIPFGDADLAEDSTEDAEELFTICADGKGNVAVVRAAMQGELRRIELQVSEDYGSQWFTAPRVLAEAFVDHHPTRNVQCLLFDSQLLVSWVEPGENGEELKLLDTHLSLLHDAQPWSVAEGGGENLSVMAPRLVIHGNVFRLYWLETHMETLDQRLLCRARISAYNEWEEAEVVELGLTDDDTIMDFHVRSLDHLLAMQVLTLRSLVARVRLHLSEDGGQQFSEDVSPMSDSSTVNSSWYIDPPALILRGDHMVMAWLANDSSNIVLRVAYSATAGRFWSFPTAMALPTSPSRSYVAPRLAAAGEARVVMALWSTFNEEDVERIDLKVFESSNHGTSWSQAEAVTDGLKLVREDIALQALSLGEDTVALLTSGKFHQRGQPRWFESTEPGQWLEKDPRPGHYGSRSNSYGVKLYGTEETLYGVYIDDRNDVGFPYFCASTDDGESWRMDHPIMLPIPEEDAVVYDVDFDVADPPAVLVQTRDESVSHYYYGRSVDEDFVPNSALGSFSGELEGRLLQLVHTDQGPFAFLYAEPGAQHLLRVRTSTDGGTTWDWAVGDLEMKPGFDRGPYLAVETDPFEALVAWYAVRSKDDEVVYDLVMAHFNGSNWETIQNSWLSGDTEPREVRPISLKNGRWVLLKVTNEVPYGTIELYTALDGARGDWTKQEGLVFTSYDPPVLEHRVDEEGSLHLLYGQAVDVGTMLTYTRFDPSLRYWSERRSVQPVVPDEGSVRLRGFGSRALWVSWIETFSRSRVLFGVFSHDGGNTWRAPIILSPDQEYVYDYDLAFSRAGTTHLGFSIVDGDDINLYDIRWPATAEDLEEAR